MKELGWRRGTKLFFFTTETRSHGDRYPPNTVILARYLGERLLYLTSAHREAFCTPRGLLHTARPSAHREAFCTPRGLLHTARRTVLSVPCTPQTDREIV